MPFYLPKAHTPLSRHTVSPSQQKTGHPTLSLFDTNALPVAIAAAAVVLVAAIAAAADTVRA